MFSSPYRIKSVSLFVTFLFLTACGNEGSDPALSMEEPSGEASVYITGGGVKGPLAFASVSLYILDKRFEQLYDPENLISSATTDAYAQINGLSVPKDTSPPYILVIDGSNAIDQNTGVTPVIKNLVTVITQDSLDSGKPMYATPYTTVAYHMLRQEFSTNNDVSIAATLADYNTVIIQSIGYGIESAVDIFSTSPIIASSVTSVEEQSLIVQYRAAIEALSTMLYNIHLKSSWTSDELLEMLAHDLYDDGMINALNIITVIMGIFSQNPMALQISNTQYLVSDITTLMEEERALTGSNSNILFFKDDIDVALQPIFYRSSNDITNGTDITDITDITDSAIIVDDNVSQSAELLLKVNFSNREIGPYAINDIKTDFQFDLNGYNEGDYGMKYGSLDIAPDPVGSGRGMVLRVNRKEGRAGASVKSGGMNFRADFSKREDVYFAYDMYLAPGHEWVKHQKNPGLLTGTILQAGHNYGEKPTAEGLVAFNATITSDSRAWWGRGDGALSTYFYDADSVQRNDFWNTSDPTLEDFQEQYYQPTGYWITVELRVKMNTVTEEGVSGLKDGLMEVWVTDPQRWVGARKVSSHLHRWRITNSMGIDGITMSNYYGGSPTNPDNATSQQQYHYYDNFIVSTSPITH